MPSELRLSFGNVAETYHRVRPPYSRELLDHAQRTLDLGRGARVLDLAAGTGRLTHELAGRFAHVVAIEPNDAMRELIADGEVLAGQAEAIPLEDASVDAVFVGEAFHWFDPARAIKEIARVLRPRGGLALVSTHWWETEPPLPDAALELLREPWERFASQRNPPWDGAFTDSPFEAACATSASRNRSRSAPTGCWRCIPRRARWRRSIPASACCYSPRCVPS